MRHLLIGLIILVLVLLLLLGCGSSNVRVADSRTLVVIDRETGVVYYPDLSPKPEIKGGSITFVQVGKAYILTGNWMVAAELEDVVK